MNLVDTSVWVDYLHASDTRARRTLRRMLSTGDLPAVTEPVVMELLAGAPDERAFDQLDTLTSSLPMLNVEPAHDYRDAALIYRAARHRGLTVRRLTDCLIAQWPCATTRSSCTRTPTSTPSREPFRCVRRRCADTSWPQHAQPCVSLAGTTASSNGAVNCSAAPPVAVIGSP
jgi:hypothetical protein